MTEQQNAEQQNSDQDKFRLDRDDENQDFVDQSKIDFDPDDGLYSGSAVTGESEIPGPHLDNDSGELTGMEEAQQSAPEDTAEQPAAESEAGQQQA